MENQSPQSVFYSVHKPLTSFQAQRWNVLTNCKKKCDKAIESTKNYRYFDPHLS